MTTANDEILRSVGQLFLTFATVETALGVQLARLISHPSGFDNATAIILSGTKTSVLLKQIQNMAYARFKNPIRNKIISACGKIRDCFNLRNDLAHCSSMPGNGGDKITLLSIRVLANNTVVPPKTLHVKQINEATDRVSNRLLGLSQLLDEAGVDNFPRYDAPSA